MQNPFAFKPVVVVTEAGHAILPSQFSLCFARFRNTEIIKTEIGWQMRLIVALKQRLCLSYIRPFGESPSPPRVVFRDWVKLRKIKRNRRDSHAPGADSRLTNTAKNMLIKTQCMPTAIL